MTNKAKPFTKAQFKTAITPLLRTVADAEVSESLELYLDPYIAMYCKLKWNKRTWDWPSEDVIREVFEGYLGDFYENIKIDWGYAEYMSCLVSADLKKKYRKKGA